FKSLPVTITATDKAVSAYLSYKRYKTADKWTECEMTRIGDDLTAFVPGEPAAGKVEYSVRIHVDGKNKILNDGVGIVARFTGEVPAIHLAIHIVFMFLSILLTFRVAMETLRKEGNYYWMVNWTLLSTVIGGLIFGPIVQKYAFGDLWTGFPFGTDLTDNKTLIVVIFWVAAFFLKK
ncbi:MAG: hypothetical protein GY757_29575, partial [bacterium]|nr:hypothetical protein [bacterium]